MIPRAPFGNTGHESTRTLFGAAALSSVGQDDADRTLEVLLDYGVNHIDTAASYGDSELRIGPWMAEHRDRFFVATKTGERTYEAARDQIRRSLERLRIDQIDLLQLHNLVDAEEWQTALGPGGALEAAVEARDAGLVRFIGVTGHGPEVAARHRQSLLRFPFDSVLLPYNWIQMQDPQYVADFEALMELCQERNVAVQTIKSVARAPWGEHTRDRGTWYRPLEDQPAIDTAVHWVLGRPGVFLNTAGDIDILPRILDAAARFGAAPSEEEVERLVDQYALESLFPANQA